MAASSFHEPKNIFSVSNSSWLKYRTNDIHTHTHKDTDTHAVLLVLDQSWKLTFSSGGPVEADDSCSLMSQALLPKEGQRSQIKSYN